MLKNIKTIIHEVFERKCQIVLLTGKMGSGKTYFVKEYMKSIYEFNDVTSPTYATCNTYITHQGTNIKHFDFYIKYNPHELEIAIEESDLIFIEWWQKEMIEGHKCIEINCENGEIIN